jgi:hypothetical protein
MKEVKTRTAKIFIDQNDILHFVKIEDVHLDYEDAIDNALVIKRLTNSEPALKLVDARLEWTIDKKAQTFLTQRQRMASTAIDEIPVNESGYIKFYPNPNDGKFTIEYKIDQDPTIEVRDVQGKLVCVNSLSSRNTASAIACENLENGVYLLKVSVGGVLLQMKKFVVAK